MRSLTVLLLVLVGFIFLLGGIPMHFADVPSPHPAADSIKAVYRAGLMIGRSISPPLFFPDVPMTRAEISVLIVRSRHSVAFVPPTPSGVFPDVPVEHWGAGWIEQAASDGDMGALNGSMFLPDSPATRADIAVLVSIL